MRPEPGGRAPATGSLRLVQRFVNSVDLEDGPDDFDTAAGLGEWLAHAGLLDPGVRVTAPEHGRALELREAIRRLAETHDHGGEDRAATATVNAAARRAGLHPVLIADASRLEPTAGGVDGALGHVVAAIHASIAEDTWPRLKACERDVCRWAFYDHSKNRSGHWCSMAGCGSREKNRRAYRRRVSRGSG
jgi:predicted RNA-binding Zn ribbon-like protein